jgi:hypothetical protein
MIPERCGLDSARRFAALLDLDFDNLLFAHGEPLIGGGRIALRQFIADSRTADIAANTRRQ